MPNALTWICCYVACWNHAFHVSQVLLQIKRRRTMPIRLHWCQNMEHLAHKIVWMWYYTYFRDWIAHTLQLHQVFWKNLITYVEMPYRWNYVSYLSDFSRLQTQKFMYTTGISVPTTSLEGPIAATWIWCFIWQIAMMLDGFSSLEKQIRWQFELSSNYLQNAWENGCHWLPLLQEPVKFLFLSMPRCQISMEIQIVKGFEPHLGVR